MQIDASLSPSPGESLRQAMRRWPSGVAVVTSRSGETSHGMTINSFTSISLDPPLVTVTMNNNTRTLHLVQQSDIFAVTVLSRDQQRLAELFAGRIPQGANRLDGLLTFELVTGAPLLAGGTAFVDCRVVYQRPMLHSTLLIGEVQAARAADELLEPLIYLNRKFTGLEEPG